MMKFPHLDANDQAPPKSKQLEQAKVKFPSLELGSSLTTLPEGGEMHAMPNYEADDDNAEGADGTQTMFTLMY